MNRTRRPRYLLAPLPQVVEQKCLNLAAQVRRYYQIIGYAEVTFSDDLITLTALGAAQIASLDAHYAHLLATYHYTYSSEQYLIHCATSAAYSAAEAFLLSDIA